MVKQKNERAASPAANASQETKRDIVEVELPRCKKCGSTDREPYHGTTTYEKPIEGEHNGEPFTHVIWKRTRCRSCGQARVDKYRENRKRKGRR